MINCSKCGNEFKKGCSGSAYRQCPKCCREYARKWALEHPEQSKESKRKWKSKNPDHDKERYRKNPEGFREKSFIRTYNITIKDYNLLLQQQNMVCAICKKPEIRKHKNGKKYNMAIDHDHNTGKIRGLLCNKCNTSLGLLDENIQNMKNMIKYI